MAADPEEVVGETLSIEDSESEVVDTADGGAMIRLKNEEQVAKNSEHFANIVEDVDQKQLSTAVSDLVDKLEKDKTAREKRDKQYEEGLKRTGLGDDAPGGAQFTGATRVVHPMLVEACIDFSARVMKEIFPSAGPVKAKILGVKDQEKIRKAERKTEYMNWQTTEQMTEFRGELEQLSTQMPLGGGQYLKLNWNKDRKRPVSEFVAIDDILLPYAATNFYSAERKTHVQYITKAEYERRVKIGMYRDVDLGSPDQIDLTGPQKANDKIEGKQQTTYNEDGLRTVFEIYTSLEFDEGMVPYILSIDKSSNKALGLYRNWAEADETQEELQWIVEFGFLPWRGAYPIGLTHAIGSLAGGSTGALRALLDSAHIQNVPTMLKLKGGPNGQTINLQPAQVTEIEGGAIQDDIRKIVMPMPFNPPSPVLFQLLGFLVNAGKEVVQTSFEKLSDASPNQPVGTTMALIEQGLVVYSSIHARMHSSMARVFKIIHRLNGDFLTEADIQAQTPEIKVLPQDFDGPVDVIPVSDPNIFSETQRFAQTQAVMQRADQKPQMYDARRIEELFLRQMKLPEDLLVQKPGEEDVDPVSENVAATMSRPIYVLPKQDHLAHIQVHLAFLRSPVFGKNPAMIKTYLFPMSQHLKDHLLNYYLTQCHNAVVLAEQESKITDDAQQQARLITTVQAIIDQRFSEFAAELAKIDQEAQQFAPKPQMPPDHSMEVAQLSAQVQTKALEQKAATDQQRSQIQQGELARKQQKDQQDAALKAQEQQLEAQQRAQEQAAEDARAQLKAQTDLQVSAQDNATREATNTADNITAMNIVAAEIQSGDKVALSTGSGINP